jgi:hypothetical protein
MMADQHQGSDRGGSGKIIPGPLKWFLMIAGGLFSLIIVIVALGALRTADLFQRLKSIENDIRIQYTELNSEFEFNPGTATYAIADDRWTKVWEIRKAVYSRSNPALSEQLQTWLLPASGNKGPGVGDLVRTLPSMVDMIDNLMDEHVRQLKSAGMSPREYHWLAGQAIYAALKEPDRCEAGVRYRELIGHYNRVVDHHEIEIMEGIQMLVIEVDDLTGMLEPIYQDAPALSDAMLSSLEYPDPLGYMLDLITAGLQVENTP